MTWNFNIEITDPEVYVKQLPTITKHITYSKDYNVKWLLAHLENFDLLKVIWESGSTYSEGYTFPGKIVFTFFDDDNLFKVGQEELIINQKHLTISQPGFEVIRLGHKPYSAISIYVDETRFLTELSKYLGRQIDRPKMSQVLDRTSTYGSSLYQMVLLLSNLIESGGHPIAIKNLESAVFSTLVQGSFHEDAEISILKVYDASIDRVRETAEYIRANLKQDITIAKIAAQMNCSSRSLQAAFARHYGSSPSQFLRIARLEAAYVELKYSNKSITEVALEYGFYNPGRFSRYFQQHFGKKPSDILRNKSFAI